MASIPGDWSRDKFPVDLNKATPTRQVTLSDGSIADVPSLNPSEFDGFPIGLLPIASQAEAEAGVTNSKLNTPLRTTQQTTARIATLSEAFDRADNFKLLTPQRFFEISPAIQIANFYNPGETPGGNLVTDNAAFRRAALSGKLVFIPPGTGGQYLLSGTIPANSNTRFTLVGGDIRIDVSGLERGFLANGIKNFFIDGSGNIDVFCNLAGPDGSYNSAVTFGPTLFGNVAPLTPTENVHINGSRITFNSVGPVNAKAVYVSGNTKKWSITGIDCTGMANLPITAHWCGNAPNDATLPTLTWHPDKFLIDDCRIINPGGTTTQRGVRLSAVGRGRVSNIQGENLLTVTHEIFAGDYGMLYTDPDDVSIWDFGVIELDFGDSQTGTNCASVSIDMQTSGKNSSPRWTGADYGCGRIYINNLNALIPDTSNTVIAATAATLIDITGIYVKEETANNTAFIIDVTGCPVVRVSGVINARRPIRARNGSLVFWDVAAKRPTYDITNTTDSGILVIGVKGNNLVLPNAVNVGDTTITLPPNIGIIAGAGGAVRWVDGGGIPRFINLTQATQSANPANTVVGIEPSLYAIAAGQTVVVISRVKDFIMSTACITDGYATGFDNAGIDEARTGNIVVAGQFYRNSINDINLVGANFAKIISTHEKSGQNTSVATCRALNVGAFVGGYDADGMVVTESDLLQSAINISAGTPGHIRNCTFSDCNGTAAIVVPSSQTLIGQNVFLGTGTRYGDVFTFTPVWLGAGTAGAPTFTINEGRFRQMPGGVTKFTVRTTFLTKGGMVGQIRCDLGLGVNMPGGANRGFVVGTFKNNYATATDVIVGYVVENQSYVVLFKGNSNNTFVQDTDLNDTTTIQFSGEFYRDH